MEVVIWQDRRAMMPQFVQIQNSFPMNHFYNRNLILIFEVTVFLSIVFFSAWFGSFQNQHAAQVRAAHVQAVPLLRPLWIPVVRTSASGSAVYTVQYERAQAVCQERGPQLWHRSQ